MMSYLNDLFNLFRKHYAENVKFYLLLALQVFGVPLLLATLSRSAVNAVTISMALMCLVMLLVVHRSVKNLRSRYTYAIENTLPVSVGVRYGFIMLNSTVVTLLGFLALYLPSLALSCWMFPIDESFEWVLENAFFSNYRALVNILSIHALILVVNILVRKRPLLGYALAALFMLIVSSVVTSFVEIEYRDAAMMCIYIAIIVTSWVGCYFLLRKFQYKS
jgi:hypothetical protein